MMNATRNEPITLMENPRDGRRQVFHFSAPPGPFQTGRLVFASDASRLELKADPGLPDLYRARFWDEAPRVWVQESVVTIETRPLAPHSQPASVQGFLAEVDLNGTLPWEIELHKGVSHLYADLRRLQLGSLDLLGLARHIWLALSRPREMIYIYNSGGIEHGTIQVPPGVGVSIRINGGASNLVFGGQRFDSAGNETCLESPDFESTASRYDICIAGGVRDLTIDYQE